MAFQPIEIRRRGPGESVPVTSNFGEAETSPSLAGSAAESTEQAERPNGGVRIVLAVGGEPLSADQLERERAAWLNVST
ncbi:MAG: hypothetical protein ABEL51_02310 [Salinibacter sp.]